MSGNPIMCATCGITYHYRHPPTRCYGGQMIDYVETYIVNGRTYGIEDYEKPGDHFFPNDTHKRFRLWAGGCGIGQAEMLGDARRILHEYITHNMNIEYNEHFEKMKLADKVLKKLSDDPFNLGMFRS